jgi:hypothetical protein
VASAALLDLQRLAARRLAGGPVLFLALGRHPGQRLQALQQPGQVADGVRLGDRRDQPADRRLGLDRRQVGAGQPLLQQADLGLEHLELALEEGQRLVRAPRLPGAHLPLALGGTHEDRAVLGHPAPRIACGTHRVPPDRYLTGCAAGQQIPVVTSS